MNIAGFEHELITKNRARSTIQNYKYMLGVFNRVQGSFTDQNVELFIQSQAKRLASGELATASYNKYIKALRAYYLFEDREPPKILKKVKERRKPPVPVTTKEVQKILSLKTQPHYDIIWKLAAHIGFRPKEILGLTLSDITETTIAIRNSKTPDGDRLIWLPKSVRKDLHNYMSKVAGTLLFPSPRDPHKSLNHAALAKDWKKRLEMLGIKKHATPYSLRHAFGGRNARRSVPETMHIMGHTNPAQTMRYVAEDLSAQEDFFDTDPLLADKMSGEQQLQQIVDELNKRGVFKSRKLEYEITDNSLTLAIKARK